MAPRPPRRDTPGASQLPATRARDLRRPLAIEDARAVPLARVGSLGVVEGREPYAAFGGCLPPRETASEHHPILRAILSARLRCVFAHPEAPRFLRARSLGVGGHYPDRVPPAGELLALVA